MDHQSVTPGPDAHRAFRLGMIAAAFVGLVAVGGLYWAGLLSPVVLVFSLLVGVPVYLVFASVALSRWLGFDKDATDLRPVYRERDES